MRLQYPKIRLLFFFIIFFYTPLFSKINDSFVQIKKNPEETAYNKELILLKRAQSGALDATLEEMERYFPKSLLLPLLWYQKGLLLRFSDPKEALHFLQRAEKQLLKETSREPLLNKIRVEKAHCYLKLATQSDNLKAKGYFKYFDASLLEIEDASISDLLKSKRLMHENRLHEALALCKNVTPSAEKAEVLGEIHEKMGNLLEAKNSFVEALSLTELELSKLYILMQLSQIQEKLDDFEAAIKSLSVVINSLIPNELKIKALTKRALLFEKMGRHDLAFKQKQSIGTAP